MKLIEWNSDTKDRPVIQETPNFKLSEFACHCQTEHTHKIDTALVIALQNLRDYLGKPIKINSGFRCPDHNYIIGGVKNSKHVLGIAVDIVIPGFTVDDYERVSYKLKTWGCNAFGINQYQGKFMHIDTRPENECKLGTVRW